MSDKQRHSRSLCQELSEKSLTEVWVAQIWDNSGWTYKTLGFISVTQRQRTAQRSVRMRIVFVTETLVTGGAETFVLRVASALQIRGVQVSICVLRPDKIDPALVTALAPNVTLIQLGMPTIYMLCSRFDGLLYLLGSSFSIVRSLQARCLKQYLAARGATVVHSNLLASDLVVADVAETLSIPWITTIHGDYLAIEDTGNSRAMRLQDFTRAVHKIENSVSHVVCITDRQISMVQRVFPRIASENRFSKIYNGYPIREQQWRQSMPEVIARVPDDAFVIGMVGRGRREKGWDALISAFRKLDLPNAWLILVGDGDYLTEVRQIVDDDRIIFAGNVADPLRYIARFDVGCMISRIPSESLPTVVIEYLLLNKPVVATDVGEVRNMIDGSGDDPAGLLVKLGECDEMSAEVSIALKRLSSDKALFETLRANTAKALQKFNMDKCLDSYLTLYRAPRSASVRDDEVDRSIC